MFCRIWFHKPVKADDWLLYVVSNCPSFHLIQMQNDMSMCDTEVHVASHENRSRAHLRMVAGVSSPDACSTGKERYALIDSEL